MIRKPDEENKYFVCVHGEHLPFSRRRSGDEKIGRSGRTGHPSRVRGNGGIPRRRVARPPHAKPRLPPWPEFAVSWEASSAVGPPRPRSRSNCLVGGDRG